MWVPRTWEEIRGLVDGGEESGVLEFKGDAGSKNANAEMAKDLAAMSVAGGVVTYGIAEDRKTRMAVGVQKLSLAGVAERVQQVVGAHIAPSCHVELIPITEIAGDLEGVLVAVVRASSLAPHMVGERYPCRRGTVTGYLTETEVAQLYERRAAMHASLPPAAAAVELFDPPRTDDGTPDAGGQGQLFEHLGRLRMMFQPIGPSIHPAAPWLADSLRAAYDRAVMALATRHWQPIAIHWLQRWEPWGTELWTTLSRSTSLARSAPGSLAPSSLAGVFAYSHGRLSFQTTRYLHIPGAGGHGEHLCAFEHEVAGAAIAFAAFAGELYSEIESVGRVQALVELAGYDGAIAWACTRAEAVLGIQQYPRAYNHTGDQMSDVSELRQAPEELAARLIDPWLVPFYRDQPRIWTALSSE